MAKHFRDRVEGSNAEPFKIKLNRNGVAIDLDGSTSTFRMVRKSDGVAVVDDLPCEDPDALGEVVYLPAIGEIVAGRFWCRSRTTMPDGTVYRSPRIGLTVNPDI